MTRCRVVRGLGASRGGVRGVVAVRGAAGRVSEERFLTAAKTVTKATLLGPLSSVGTGAANVSTPANGGLQVTLIKAKNHKASV